MPCGFFVWTLGTLLFAALLGVSRAQDRSQAVPPFLDGSEITLELSYSCPTRTACSFACPNGMGEGAAVGGRTAAGESGRRGGSAGGLGAVGNFFGANHVTKLIIYLGTMRLGKGRDVPILVYGFSTREGQNSSGFSINAGLSATSCQINGLALDYSGRPRQGSSP